MSRGRGGGSFGSCSAWGLGERQMTYLGKGLLKGALAVGGKYVNHECLTIISFRGV